MNRFGVHYIYKTNCGDGRHYSPHFNQQVRVTRAKPIRHSMMKAQQFAGACEQPLKNRVIKAISWNSVYGIGVSEMGESAVEVAVGAKMFTAESIGAYLKNSAHRNKIFTKLNP